MGLASVYRQTIEYQEGRNAYREGIRRGQNPYSENEKGSSHAWWMGWDDEEEKAIQEKKESTS